VGKLARDGVVSEGLVIAIAATAPGGKALDFDDQLTASNALILRMKICTAGALGANRITLRRVPPLKIGNSPPADTSVGGRAIPVKGSAATIQGPYDRLRISCRLCISAAVCSMRNNGTRNAGISSSGSVAIGAVLISPGAPVAKRVLTAPMLTAMRRSNIPRTFHLMNVPLAPG
jgi:hypothetical protein